jgi:nucleoid-associated protein YgaU
MTDPLQEMLQRTVDRYDPFPPESRYSGIAIIETSTADGRTVRYVGRRFVPRGSSLAQVAQHTVAGGDRLDNIAAAYLGDPELFWRICDANDALRPSDLVVTPGRRLRIAMPAGVPAPVL